MEIWQMGEFWHGIIWGIIASTFFYGILLLTYEKGKGDRE